MTYRPFAVPGHTGACVVLAVALGLPMAVFAQAFPIVPPKLPPRAAGTGAAPGAQSPAAAQPYAQAPVQQPVQQPSQQSTHASRATPQPAYTPQGPVPQGTATTYAPQNYAPQAHAPQAALPALPTQSLPAAPAGRCRVLPSPERQSLALVSGEPPLPREQLPLGEFRAQQVVHSPDGRWAVAFTKLRGAPQFAALTIDLDACRLQHTIDLPGAGSDAAFDGEQALLRYAGGERKVDLKDRSVR